MRPAADLRLEEGMMLELVMQLDLHLYIGRVDKSKNLIENIMFR